MPIPTRAEQLERKNTFLDAKCKCVGDAATMQRRLHDAFDQYWDGLITRDELGTVVDYWATNMKVAFNRRIAKLEP